ncbi:dihydrouridine synthase-domain-containing protein [Coniella lustricola]|uniref:tRNA-dihydrouridine(16/17) synthase [NAD(P)(+)] n=1 Tax=Coniella lustricola TaxID=2025994 RepID=A0A2T3ABB1_9PEZI|nr:dihydrouridine synthase-domain-containing protein [Coniella lustricola]
MASTFPAEMADPASAAAAVSKPAKLHGRAFYESIGSPKYIVAPMVDQSEFAWRMLSRSFMPESERGSILAYSPMFHARLFADSQKYRDSHFQPTKAATLPSSVEYNPTTALQSNTDAAAAPYLDGNAAIDRPLFVQFCANDPKALLAAAKIVAPYCDAVDLNFGCPQGIARKGHYGAFLQEDQTLIHSLVKILHENLSIPVTAKIRILETKEETLAYARNVLSAGASILTVHGRRREQKGHLTGLADWEYIRYLRENLPKETVIFANGNILQYGDLQRCLAATGADGIMSAEGNLSDPGLFAPPEAKEAAGREYWRGKDGKGGWRVDAVVRRYLDIMHRYVVGQEPPARRPLFAPGDDETWLREAEAKDNEKEEPVRKKRRKDDSGGGRGAGGMAGARPPKMTSSTAGPNFVAMQAHLFHLLRHFVTKHHDVRDVLAKSRLGDISIYESILELVERKVAEGLLEYERTGGKSVEGDEAKNGAYDKGSRADDGVVASEADIPAGAKIETEAVNGAQTATTDGVAAMNTTEEDESIKDDPDSSVATVKRCKRPWWVVQPIIRPLPKEAMAKGAISLSKKEKQKLAEEEEALKKRLGSDTPDSQATPKPINLEQISRNGDISGNGEGGGENSEEAQMEQTTEALEKATSFPDSGLVSG